MNKKEAEELTDHILITDALIQLKVIQDLLISKGVFTKEEFDKSIDSLSKQIAKSILESANVPGDIDAMLDSLNKNKNQN